MSWAKIDDKLHSHPKVIEAGPEALALWALALSWSSAYLTDGFIPEKQIVRLGATDEIAERLVAADLWDRVISGYQITQTIRWRIGRELSTQEMRKTAKYRAWRRAVVERDESTCKMCGSKNRPLHAHHIKEWVLYPDKRFKVENGITLCEVCHSKIHGRQLYADTVV